MAVNGISKPALKMLLNYSWPGNVRQLESVIERGVLMAEGNSIMPEDLPVEVHETVSGSGTLPFEFPADGISFEDLERDLIIKAMERADWTISKAAPLLKMSYKTLQYRLEKFGIEKPQP
jgi:DNA-binding NtrC family response regulator